tara:strand:- start:1293 stop:1718 length:426 start_codon:yes stop_codon:yes gene_type:complete
MKLKISVAVDFNKLANEMPKIIEKTTQRYARSAERGSKEAINKGVKPKLKESTIARRKRKKTGGSKPLFETGSLFRSIKGTSEGLTLNEYGFFHHTGNLKPGTPQRQFITTSKKDIMPIFDKFKKDVNQALRRKTPLVLET